MSTSGLQSSAKTLSTTTFAVPESVEENAGAGIIFATHNTAMTHHLCNIWQSTKWLMKPVNKMFSRIQASKKRSDTRSLLQHARLGQNIFLHASQFQASKFVCDNDNVALIDFVENDPTR